MKNRTIIIIVILLLLIGWVIYLGTRIETPFNRYEFREKNIVLNKGPKPYLDTILQVGLDKLKITNQTITIREQETKRNLGNGIQTDAYIINEGNQSIIYIKPTLSRMMAIKILSHELIHLQQYTQKRLKVINKNLIKFNNDTINIYLTPYESREWEIEAFKLSPLLEKQIQEELQSPHR